MKFDAVVTPVIFTSFPLIVTELVPTVNIPVTLALPVTTKSSPQVVPPPTCAFVTVIIPATISLVPAPATIGPLNAVAVITPTIALSADEFNVTLPVLP